MVAYVLRRLLGAVPTIFVGLSLTFFVIHLAPGNPAARFLDPTMGIELQKSIAQRFALDDPLHVQYF